MQIIERVKKLWGEKWVKLAVAAVVIAVAIVSLRGVSTSTVTETSKAKPVVTLITANEYAGGQSLSLIGTVRAFSEAAITAEGSGRVTRVNVGLGDYVQAGTIIATLENASEQAAVLQAEGVYDAAVAAAAQSGVGVDEAKNRLRAAEDTAVSAFKSSYNTVNGIVLNSVDAFFADPNGRVPGLRIDGKGLTFHLNDERVAYQTLLPEWQTRANTITVDSDLRSELEYAAVNVQRTIDLVDSFLTVFSKQDNSTRYTDADIVLFTNAFTGLRSSLIGVQSSVNAALTGLSAAADGVRRAELAAEGGTVSAADAQVKQALGTLRAAQANLAKTILHTPIGGTVNSLSVQVGDFVGSFTEVAVVANNNALEIVTYLSESEKDMLAVGDEVVVEGKYAGVVSHISPAVNNDTKKIEVRIATEGLDIVNGDTVRVTKEVAERSSENVTVRVPLSAVKFDAENGSIFVVEDGHLVARSITIGVVRGGSVEVKTGLEVSEAFVKDARGLIANEEVDIAK